MKKKNAFTLIELLSVLVILGIIITISVQTYGVIIDKNDDTRYKYYNKFITKALDLYFDSKKEDMINGECLSVDYKRLIEKDYLKEEGITCSGNLILRKEKNKYIYDDSNLECSVNNKIIKEKSDIEAVCKKGKKFVFDENYERTTDISDNDNWLGIGGIYEIEESYDLGNGRVFSFSNNSKGISQNLTETLLPDRKYKWTIYIKTNKSKNLKVGVGTTGLKDIETDENWQRIEGEFTATKKDSNEFYIISTNGFSSDDYLYVNSIKIYDTLPSLKNTVSFAIGNEFGDDLPTPERKGYDFKGWYTEKDGGEQITKETIVSEDSATTYYAHWTPKKIKVLYKVTDTGTAYDHYPEYGGTEHIIKQTNMVHRSCHTFLDKWEENNTKENISIWFGTPIIWDYAKDVTLEAQYEERDYTVYYHCGKETLKENGVKCSDNFHISDKTCQKDGYKFAGWTINKDGTDDGYNLISDKQKTWTYIISNYGVYSKQEMNLYAMWKPNTYTVTFNANGGSDAPGSQTKEYGKNLTLSSTKPKRDGYTFQGWATSQGGNVVYKAGDKYTNNENITLYAVWKQNKAKITVFNDYEFKTGTYYSSTNNTASIDKEFEVSFDGNSYKTYSISFKSQNREGSWEIYYHPYITIELYNGNTKVGTLIKDKVAQTTTRGGYYSNRDRKLFCINNCYKD